MKRTHNKAFGTDFETGTGNSGSLWINCHCLHLGKAAQKIVSQLEKHWVRNLRFAMWDPA